MISTKCAKIALDLQIFTFGLGQGWKLIDNKHQKYWTDFSCLLLRGAGGLSQWGGVKGYQVGEVRAKPMGAVALPHFWVA